jgi:hypothetical protein
MLQPESGKIVWIWHFSTLLTVCEEGWRVHFPFDEATLLRLIAAFPPAAPT